jgi:hypothetical protein
VNTGGSSPRDSARRPLAVASDGSGFRRDPGSTVLTGLLGSAALLREHAAIAANAVLVTAESDQELITELRRLAPNPCGVYLAHTDATRGRNAQAALAGTPPVITDVQTTAIAMTAALLTTLDRAGLAPSSARLVILGADRNPLVSVLAVAAGIGEVDSFGLDEVQNIRLRTLTYRATAVIDLLGAAVPRGVAGASGQSPPVIAVDDAATPLLALPGLLAAAHASTRPVSPTTCLAATLAMVELTPADQLLPRLSDPGLAKIVVSPGPRPPITRTLFDDKSRRQWRLRP